MSNDLPPMPTGPEGFSPLPGAGTPGREHANPPAESPSPQPEGLLLSDQFRHDLAGQLPLWQKAGLVPAAGAATLNQWYRLDQLGAESGSLMTRNLFILGGLLTGGGVLAFVAAHWEGMPVPVKLALLAATWLGFHLAGWWLWTARDREALGKALIFVGCLVFGANIGLIAQIFHISGDLFRGVGAWALGTLPLAFACASGPTGGLSLLLAVIWSLGSSFWNRPGGAGWSTAWTAFMLVFPWILAGVFLALARQARSRWLTSGVVLAVLFTAIPAAAASSDSEYGVWSTTIALLFLVLIAAEAVRRIPTLEDTGHDLHKFGFAICVFLAFVATFKDIWPWRGLRGIEGIGWLLPLLVIVGLAGWLLREESRRAAGQPWRQVRLATLTGGAGLLFFLLLIQSSQVAAVFVAHGAFLCFAVAALAPGVGEADRRSFWTGMGLLFLLVVARFFEYETSLLLKSVAFLALGLGTIYAGNAYERFLQRKEAPRG
ncbi:MAG: DUF2157 domain-containing protein [Candidatus Riflebacteria bacterium]|nr:DUF2157 domain-containing protein [Candidatus Riflebacteria bacterium]